MKILPLSGPLAGASLLLFLLGQPTCLGQGGLTPPGPPGPTMKTLDQIDAKLEKRTPISALPYAISARGSYYVTGNLTGVSGQNGITITANDVNLDLNGFRLVGVVGAKIGINIVGGVTRVSVSNGSVAAWPMGGVAAGFDSAVGKTATGCRFTALHLGANGLLGLNAGYGALVKECIADQNFGVGIYVGVGSTVSHCNSNSNSGNSGFGFLTYFNNGGGSGVHGPTVFNSCNASGNSAGGYFVSGSVVTDCVAYSNQKGGFSADNSTLRGCVADGNLSTGVFISTGIVEGCIALNNGNAGSGAGFQAFSGATLSNCTARINQADGITAYGGSSVTACTTASNGASGINLSDGSSAIGCTSYSNNGDGIKTSDAGYVARCNADSNDLAGIHVTQGSNRIEGNKVTNNANGIKVDTTLNLIYGNTARGNTGAGGNYSIITGNRVGTIVIPPVSGNVTGNSGAAGFNSTDPWANIAF